MLGTSLQFGRGQGEDRFYNPAKARRSHHHHPHQPQRPRSIAAAGISPSPKQAPAAAVPENRACAKEEPAKPVAGPSYCSSPCNLDRFLESTTPSVPAEYLSKTGMRGWRTCDRTFFALKDLWESFKEWSAYGAGVPLVLNGCDSVVQYYVPYLSGIQLYAESSRPPSNSRIPGEESDGDSSRDSCSDGSSDYEHDLALNCSRAWNSNDSNLRIDRLSLREKHGALQEGSSSDDGESRNSQGHLLFEFLERDPPHIREPLADKVSLLARRFPELRKLTSHDLLPSSWISVAWYPIYRIPTGPTLRDLDACFLTFHSLSTQQEGSSTAPASVIYSQGVDCVPKISLPAFGLASYKFKGTIWTPNGGCERQVASNLLQAADNWLRELHVNHPDYGFFATHGQCWR